LPVNSRAAALLGLARIRSRGDYMVPPGGSSPTGALGYLTATQELAQQVRAHEAPEPDAIVVPLGSGGTAAGILAGIAREGLESRVIAVDVAIGSSAGTLLVLALARAALRTAGATERLSDLVRRLTVERGYLGAGYGHATASGATATEQARALGLELEPTYTAKTFAAALDVARRSPGQVVLYWHTLSSHPLEPLLADAPGTLPPALAALLPGRP
jgi:1-aminocyclopropane-1-carboxylate deaminase/D-cysteine desulfhydrase-like pyridoxal-dependent ACC family enzyme